jgi:hypothetical protein
VSNSPARKKSQARYGTSAKGRATGTAATRRWRARNVETERERTKEWQKAHPEKMAAYDRRKRIKGYGLTVEEYEAILAKGCAICGTHEGVVLDHDHKTGRPRAGLCRFHNMGIGFFGDDPEALRRAADYLEEHA